MKFIANVRKHKKNNYHTSTNITIPKEVVDKLELNQGDKVEITIKKVEEKQNV